MKRVAAFIILIVLVFGSAVLGTYVGASLVSSRDHNAQQIAQPSADDSIPSTNVISISSSEISTTITQAVEKVEPAVVTVVGQTSGQMTFFGYSGDQQVSGSGFIITANGYIITNNHVVADASSISVILSDGTELDAQVINTDKYADLAVLRTEGEMPGVAVLGDSDNLKPGETVIAIGSPLGDFRNSVTVGVVSATGRTLDTGNGYEMENLIQTDAAINSGNSGGPLVNLAGEVVGINTAVVRGSSSSASAEGLGFAIPSNIALLISQQIIDQGYFARPYLGVTVQPVNPSVARRYELPVEWGAYITRVGANSPAAQAGLQVGDIIVRMGEKELDENTQFLNALFSSQPGDVIEVEVLRQNTRLVSQVTLVEAVAR